MALARAALALVDEVLFVIPRVFPHKEMESATLDQRVAIVAACIEPEQRFSLGIAERGLFVEIAREVRDLLGDVELSFLCGRDAAERILHWDYGDPGAREAMLREFSLCVAPRAGPLEHPSPAVRPLEMAPLDEVSSTEVRERIRSGRPWRHLVPAEAHGAVQAIYE